MQLSTIMVLIAGLALSSSACDVDDIVPDGGPAEGSVARAIGLRTLDGALEESSVFYLKRKERCGLPNRDVFELNFDDEALVLSQRSASSVNAFGPEEIALPDDEELEVFAVEPASPSVVSGTLFYDIVGVYARREGFELVFEDGTMAMGEFSMPYEGRGPRTDCGPDLPDDQQETPTKDPDST